MEEELTPITGGPLKPHEYVLVKSELTAGDEAWIQNHSAKVSGDPKNPQITLTIGDVQLATLKRVIKGWNLTRTVQRGEGVSAEVPIPFSTEAIEQLPVRIYKYVLKEYNKLNPDDEEESEADFLLAVVDSSEENLQAERVLRLKH